MDQPPSTPGDAPGSISKDDLEIDPLSSLPPAPPLPEFPVIPESLKNATGAPTPKGAQALVGVVKGWAMALDFVFSIIAAWLIGFLIDRWQGTAPWGSLIGLALGLTGALVRIMRQMARQEQAEARQRAFRESR
jgi:F0F1-type ATP synthase assembly protein I